MRTALRAGVYDLAPTAIDRPAFDARRFALLERIARGEPLPELLRGVVRLIEDEAPGMLGSIVLFADGRISAAVGDSLPPAFRDALSGLAIGPRAGSCGTAAYLNQRVIVDDISSHEYWTDYRAMAEPFGLRACWSSPIHLPERGVVASFAMYYRERRSPTSDEIRLIDEATCLTAVAIQRDLADRELRASEERLRAVIEHSPNVCIQWYDADARMLFANDASRRLFGWARGSEVGRRLDELNFPPAAAARFQQAVAAVHATGQPQGPMEFEFAHPDGSTGVLLSTVFRIPLAGDTFCCACMDVDLTEHRRLEHAARADERLRALVYSMVADVIFYVGIEDGPRYRFLCVNDAFLRATGLTEADVVGKWVDEVIPPPALPLVLERYAEAVRTGQPVTWDEESRYPAGVKRGEVTVAPVVDGNGRCTHLIGTVHDVTERVAAVEERRQLEQQLHRAQRLQSLGTFAGGIAHDFNNLLNAIRGYADLALADVEDPAASTGSLVELTRTTSRASDLVRRILLFSRGETPNLEPVAAAPLLEEAIRLIRVNLPPRITVEHPAMSQLPPMLADATQVHQVLMNLLTNAVQAMGDAGGVIAISCDTIAMDQGLEPDLRPGRYVRISVHDNGCGMDPLTQRGSSSRSSPPRAPSAAPAWDCRSCTGSCAPTAAR